MSTSPTSFLSADGVSQNPQTNVFQVATVGSTRRLSIQSAHLAVGRDSWGRTLYVLRNILLESTHVGPRLRSKQAGLRGTAEGHEGFQKRGHMPGLRQVRLCEPSSPPKPRRAVGKGTPGTSRSSISVRWSADTSLCCLFSLCGFVVLGGF